MSYEGDKILAVNDMQIWNLVYEAVIRYSTIVIFKSRPINVNNNQPQIITFLVDANSENYLTTVQYIQNEGKSLSSDPAEGWPGTIVEVLPFNGLSGHMDSSKRKELAKNALNTLYDSLMKRSAEGKKVHKTPGTEH